MLDPCPIYAVYVYTYKIANKKFFTEFIRNIFILCASIDNFSKKLFRKHRAFVYIR